MDDLPPEALQQADEQLEEWSKPQIEMLWAVTRWYNGVRFDRKDESYQIGWNRPPPMQTLLGCSDVQWDQKYESVFTEMRHPDRLRSVGRTLLKTVRKDTDEMPQTWFGDQHILRHKVKWDPTREARVVMDTLFDGLIEPQDLLYTPSADEGGLIGDWNESLLHRTGVALVATIWRQQGWQVQMYPGKPGQSRPDITATALDGTTWTAEVLTAHHDASMARTKFDAFATDPTIARLWVFEDRRAAVRTLSQLHEHDGIDCRIVNAPFDPPNNWSPQTVNEYIQRSQINPDYACPGIDRIDTVTACHDRLFQNPELRRRSQADIDG